MAPTSVLGPRHWVCGRNWPHLPPPGSGPTLQPPHTPLPVSDTFWAGAQRARSWEWTSASHHPPRPTTVSCRSTLLPTALLMALTQKLDATHPRLSSPCKAQSFDLRPGVSAWSLSYLTTVPSREFPYAERMSTMGLNPRVGQLTSKCATANNSLWLPLSPTGHSGGPAERCLDSRHRKLKLVPLSLFLAPPPQSVPRKLLLFPEPLHLEGWERETVRPSEGTSRNCGGETDFEERTTQWRPQGIYISCVWLSIRQAEGRADSKRPGQESARLRTVPRPVSLQGVVQWVGFRRPSLLGPTPLSVPLHLWIPQPFQNPSKTSTKSQSTSSYQTSCSFMHLFTYLFPSSGCALC